MYNFTRLVCTSVLLLFTSLSPLSHQDSRKIEERAHGAAYHIAQMVVSNRKICSATAVGPHALLTAAHCELPTDELYIEGQQEAVTIVNRIRDGADHTIYLIAGIEFPSYATITVKPELHIGDDVFLWGNPGDWQDILRRGYIAGEESGNIVYSFRADHGDSGAAIFDSHGDVIEVLSFIDCDADDCRNAGIIVGGSIPLDFKQSDVTAAEGFVPDAKL